MCPAVVAIRPTACPVSDSFTWTLKGGQIQFGVANPEETVEGDDAGIDYDVVRGDLLSLRASGGDFGVASIDCREEDSADTASTVAVPPVPGEPYFYLVRSQRECRHGTFDTGQLGQQGGRDLEIDTSIDRCN